jgi:RNA polymerase sigma-70 factor (ECF subfamily)
MDLARHYQGPQGLGAHHISQRPETDGGRGSVEAPGVSSLDPQRLAEWSELHEQISQLPDGQRELFDLLWYGSLSQEEAADLLQISARQLRRRWREARLLLHDRFGSHLPQD